MHFLHIQLTCQEIRFGFHEASNVDGVSGETILGMLAAGETNIPFDVSQMFYGAIPGSIAETSTLMVLIGAAVLIYTGVGSWRIMLGSVIGAAATYFYLIYGEPTN